MPELAKPLNDVDRLAFLKRSVNSGLSDQTAGHNYLSQETINEVEALAEAYDKALSDISTSQSERSREIRQRTEALEQLAAYVRDFWEVARRRVYRLKQPAEVLTFYGLPLDGMSPKPTRPDEWLGIADHLARGDAEAVAAGYPAMSNPSAAEITAVLAAARLEAEEANTADRVYDAAQEQLAALRTQADQLIDDILAELRYTLRRKDAPSQRRIMRSYGAVYTYLQGEPQDPDDQPDVEPQLAEETLA
jgi:ElaB/YqjD/DUF883 family membrane-anchored ribosome-binding protein